MTAEEFFSPDRVKWQGALSSQENPERIVIQSTIERALETEAGSKLLGFAARTYGLLDEIVEIHIYSYPWPENLRASSDSAYGAAVQEQQHQQMVCQSTNATRTTRTVLLINDPRMPVRPQFSNHLAESIWFNASQGTKLPLAYKPRAIKICHRKVPPAPSTLESRSP